MDKDKRRDLKEKMMYSCSEKFKVPIVINSLFLQLSIPSVWVQISLKGHKGKIAFDKKCPYLLSCIVDVLMGFYKLSELEIKQLIMNWFKQTTKILARHLKKSHENEVESE